MTYPRRNLLPIIFLLLLLLSRRPRWRRRRRRRARGFLSTDRQSISRGRRRVRTRRRLIKSTGSCCAHTRTDAYKHDTYKYRYIPGLYLVYTGYIPVRPVSAATMIISFVGFRRAAAFHVSKCSILYTLCPGYNIINIRVYLYYIFCRALVYKEKKKNQ